MNWNNIKEKCPEAYEKFTFWNVNRLEKILSGHMVTADLVRDMIESAMGHSRHLYDFFDEQGILIGIKPYWELGTGLLKWEIMIFSNEYLIERMGGKSSRTEAEQGNKDKMGAFEKSFEILENHLGKEGNDDN